jgi:fluoroacetyl-CoA thioesterase
VQPVAELGATAALTITVTADMTARFDDEDVHPVYGTAALVRHMEQVSRRLLVPLREAGEEGVGAEISVRQLAPVPVGGAVELTATVTDASRRRLVTTVEARHRGEVVATGTFTQVTVDLARWRASAGLD